MGNNIRYESFPREVERGQMAPRQPPPIPSRQRGGYQHNISFTVSSEEADEGSDDHHQCHGEDTSQSVLLRNSSRRSHESISDKSSLSGHQNQPLEPDPNKTNNPSETTKTLPACTSITTANITPCSSPSMPGSRYGLSPSPTPHPKSPILSRWKRSPLSRSRSGGIFSYPFKSDRDKMDHLTELLNQYSSLGIPGIKGAAIKRASSVQEQASSSSLLPTTAPQFQHQTSLTAPSNANLTYLTNDKSNRRKSYQPPSPQHQQKMRHQYQTQRPGSYQETITLRVESPESYDELRNVIPAIDPSDRDLFLEDDWRLIVAQFKTFEKRTEGQQDAFWELLTTEAFYIKRLRVIHNLFHVTLSNLQSEAILNDVDTEKMFGNIKEIYESNHYFWMNHLLPVVKHSRITGRKLDPLLMEEGFIKFEELFTPYTKYCSEHGNCVAYVKSKSHESELFKAYIVWCETRKDCERLRLTDLLAKPMQRLTKYSLLLKAILRKTDDETEINALKRMNECVESFVIRVDGSLRRKSEAERVSWLGSRTESDDVDDMTNTNNEWEKVSPVRKDLPKNKWYFPTRRKNQGIKKEEKTSHQEAKGTIVRGADSISSAESTSAFASTSFMDAKEMKEFVLKNLNSTRAVIKSSLSMRRAAKLEAIYAK